ncbi:hypothetical protein CVD28_01755 [Bacillus sp. M6-12]|uniref:hypothetical protein n=1 Tax=Bacillus sp. M6-12 TaxID=2054166 RepID=UPI000C787BB4|nr:hypothetical protein [Bacillus sp. M6-12]PLS19159.1 hypothetical protein CVD28_01755 [Bacillus sp. M6-12]
MYIQFTGDFKKLIPMGYKFSKLYASNYICYHKDELWIWKKGKELEIADFYSRSHVVLQYLIDHDFVVPNEYNLVVLNQETSQIEDYERTKHSDMYFFGKLSEEEMEQFYKRYHRKFLQKEMIDALKELYELKLIEIKGNEPEGFSN